METKVTEVEIVPIKPRDGLVAIASCVIDSKLYIGSLGIQTKLSGDYGSYRLLWPTKRVGTREINIFHPITKDTYSAIEKAVLGKYEAIMKDHYSDLKFTDKIDDKNLRSKSK